MTSPGRWFVDDEYAVEGEGEVGPTRGKRGRGDEDVGCPAEEVSEQDGSERAQLRGGGWYPR